MKALIKILLVLISTLVIITCKKNQVKVKPDITVSVNNEVTFSNDQVSFRLPDFFVTAPELLEQRRNEGNDYLCYFRYKKSSEETYEVRLSRYEMEEPIPAEVVFNTIILKGYFINTAVPTLTVKDFGVYDHNDTRYRYIATELGDGFTETYFFMQSDSSKIIYNLLIDCYKEYGATADSLITGIAQSFCFLSSDGK